MNNNLITNANRWDVKQTRTIKEKLFNVGPCIVLEVHSEHAKEGLGAFPPQGNFQKSSFKKLHF